MSFDIDERKKIVACYERYGYKRLVEMLEFSGITIDRSTIIRWRQRVSLAESSQGLISISDCLYPRSTRPKKYRQGNIHGIGIIIEFIKTYRRKRFRAGKEKLAMIINSAVSSLQASMEIQAEYGKNYMLFGLSSVSPSTVGRIINDLKRSRSIPRTAKEYNAQKEVYLDGGTGQVKVRKVVDRSRLNGKAKLRKPSDYKPEIIGELVQQDAVTVQTTTRNKYTGAIKRKNFYFICGIDIVSRIAFCYRYDNLNSKNSADFTVRFQTYLSSVTNQTVTIKNIQTDNGQENHKHFHRYLDDEGITHFWNYPRSPKMNAYIEKFNHTVQAECIEWYLHHLRHSQIDQFDNKLQEWNNYYNHKRPHMSLQYMSPMQFYSQQIQSSEMMQM